MKLCSVCWNQSCKHEKYRYVEIDDEIAPIIVLLNKKGYHTKYCCAGHEENKVPQLYIMFQKPMYRFIKPKDIGEGFKFRSKYSIIEVELHSSLNLEEKKEILKEKRAELYNYVLKLPNISNKNKRGV